MLTPRDYQKRGIDDIRGAYQHGLRAPLYVLPTGGGKTVVFSYIAHLLEVRNKRALILVHRIELLRQTSEALRKNGVRHGLINPKFTPDYHAPVQVASVQTLTARLGKLKGILDNIELVIIDEAHHATTGSWRKILDFMPHARVLGVTATPIRSDGQGLGQDCGGMFDGLILGPQIPELIQRGFLVPPVVYAPKEKLDLTGVRTRMGDYDKHQVEERVDRADIIGNAVEHYAKLCHGQPAVAFCVSVRHAQHVAEQFRAAGFRSYSVDGSMDDDTRKRILSGLGNGQVQVVTSCDIISEGTDIPAIAAAILLRPTKSTGLFIQQVGRALRPVPGKDRAIILDHVGNTLIHGFPDEPREWTLDGEVKKKKKASEPAVRVTMCVACFLYHPPAPVCPSCGHVHEPARKGPKEKDGELQEITAADKVAMKRQRAAEQSRAQTLEELVEYGKRMGYRDGWARHVYMSRQKKQGGINAA